MTHGSRQRGAESTADAGARLWRWQGTSCASLLMLWWVSVSNVEQHGANRFRSCTQRRSEQLLGVRIFNEVQVIFQENLE